MGVSKDDDMADDSSILQSTAELSNSNDVTKAMESTPLLLISRNKHWRYISCFHGPWIHLPHEVLEILANSNWALQPPRPVDPALFFDLLKIRKLVDEATDLSVRAASGVASSAISNSLNAANSMYGSNGASLGLGIAGAGSNAKLSPERKFRMREQATQKLLKAYHLDEIACSVATMQGASILEDVANQVKRRNREHLDGNYVHYFHEKIRTRQLLDPMTLKPLDDIIKERPMSAELLRTRAIAKILQEDYTGALQDLTQALQLSKYRQNIHKGKSQKTPTASSPTAEAPRSSRWKEEIKLDEEYHPSSLETQLLFHRAGVYLAIACQHIEDALSPKASKNSTEAQSGLAGSSTERDTTESRIEEAQTETERNTHKLEAGKLVKSNAKRALRDYMAFLSHFDYSPRLHSKHTEDFIHKVNEAALGCKLPRPQNHKKEFDGDSNPLRNDLLREIPQPIVHQISLLFSATPPIGLPPHPQTYVSTNTASEPNDMRDTSAIHESTQQLLDMSSLPEALTYHPLLTEALHSLLLCHTLIQTSIQEQQRHAYMVARLARICDGYPVLQAARAPSRTDWIDVLSAAGGLALGASWDDLCRPAVYRMGNGPAMDGGRSRCKNESEDERRNRQMQESIIGALEDTNVYDKKSLDKSIFARQRRQEEEEKLGYGDGAQTNMLQGEAYDVGSMRARNIIRWFREAPVIASTGTRKKRKGTRKRAKDKDLSGLDGSVSDNKTIEAPQEDAD